MSHPTAFLKLLTTLMIFKEKTGACNTSGCFDMGLSHEILKVTKNSKGVRRSWMSLHS